MTKEVIIFPKDRDALSIMGENIKLARKRRSFSLMLVCERAGVDMETLNLIEEGNESVFIGHYFNVLKVLGLKDHLTSVAKEDPFGQKLIDLKLLSKDD